MTLIFVLLILSSCHENQSSEQPEQFDPQIDAIAAAPLPVIDPGQVSNVAVLSEPIEIRTSEQLEASPSDSEEAEIEETTGESSFDSSAGTKDESLPENKNDEDTGPA